MKRVIILMLDSFGIGAAADAENFGDKGSNTYANILKTFLKIKKRHLKTPHLNYLGLSNAAFEASGANILKQNISDPENTYGYAAEISSGKDTLSGHWELSGVPVFFKWGTFEKEEDSFPEDLLKKIYEKYNITGSIGNCHASGTEILKQLGEEHLRTNKPIFYTSKDSVFQVACHEEKFGLEKLYKLCSDIKKELEPLNIARVIARPFAGTNKENFFRTENRKDFATKPISTNVFELVEQQQGVVHGVGKIHDIYAGAGITHKHKAANIEEMFDKTFELTHKKEDNSVIFTNFVDFDSLYGHRRDPIGYGEALEYFDQRLGDFLKIIEDDDLLIITADHGCDPTWHGVNHTREYVPILVKCSLTQQGNIGHRMSFADIGQTISAYFGLEKLKYGKSFLK